MPKPSDPDQEQQLLWEKLIGLGERSHRKSYYPELQQRLEELERFRDVLDQSNDAIFLLESPTARILDANLTACRLLGLSRRDVLEKTLFALTGLVDIPEARNLIRAARDETHPIALSVETVLFSKGGDGIPVEVSLNRHSTPDHDHVAAVVRDISERRQAQKALAERTRLAELRAATGKALTEAADMDASLQACAEAIEACTDAAFVRIWTLDDSEKTLELRASAGLFTHKDGNHSRINIDEYPYKLGVICRERRAHLTNDVIGDPQFSNQEWARREGIVAFVGYPLLLQERLVGVVALFSKIALTETVVDLLDSVADTIAIGIERYHTLDALSRAVSRSEQSRDRIDAIVRSIADGLVVTDMAGRIILMNRRAERLFGVAQKLAMGRPFEQIVRSRTLRERLAPLLEKGDDAALVDLELSDHERGEVRSIQARTSQVRSKRGEVTALVTTFRDVTREKEVDRMKSEFITVAAHELRTPLTTVKGFSELMLNSSGLSDVEIRDYTSHIYNKAGVLEMIVDELLDLSRMESGGALSLTREPSRIVPFLAELVDEYRDEYPGYDFRFSMPQADIELLIDPEKISSVVSRLLDNAVRFCPEGTTVSLEGRLSGDTYRIALRDEGPGMSDEQVLHCFDRFYRGDTGDTARGGLGLGLTIARAIVEAHGGEVQLESEVGEGTTVSFTLPLEKGRQDKPESLGEAKQGSG